MFVGMEICKSVTKKMSTDVEYVSACMRTWGTLLDTRLGMQSLLTGVNTFPQFPIEADVAADEEMSSSYEQLKTSLCENISTMLEMQTLSATRCNSRQQRKRKISDLWVDVIAPMNETVFSWSLAEADKWKNSTRLSKTTDLKTLESSLSEQLEFAFRDPDQRIIKRTQPPSGKFAVLGETNNVENIYDDTGFYASLLKEAIACGAASKGSGINIRSVNKQKDQALVDRRASKGRKLKYTPIEKLVGFLAPQPPSKTPITDEGFIRLLMSSLFQ